MVLFVVLGVVVAITFAVLGVLFYMLGKEGKKREEEKAVPLTDLAQLRKELSSGLLEPQKPKFAAHDSAPVDAYELKVSLPTQQVHVTLEDDVYKKRAKELEDELRAIDQKAQNQSNEAKQIIDTLTKENESLKSQKAELEQAQQNLSELQLEASGLKNENTGLQAQLESASARVHSLEEEMAVVKIQMGEELVRANAKVDELNKEKEVLPAAPKPEPDEDLRQELESLKFEHAQLRQKCDELQKAHQQLQYDLVKARAQSSGLERVSFNYKNQLEDFFKKIHATQVANDHLSQVKNRLEGMVKQIKLENEELAQKDRLAQFEIEKNRSRLVSLEREYEDLKARTPPKDPQA